MEELATSRSSDVAPGELFSDFVCRLGAVPADCLEPLRAVQSMERVQQLIDVESDLDAVRTDVSDLLYDVIGDTQDQEARNALLQVRRDAYNLRPLSEDDLEAARPAMPDDAELAVDRLIRLTARQDELLDAVAKAFGDELAEARERFQDLVKHPGFQKGLLISSETLYDLQQRYQKAGGTDVRSKQERLERGLLRYFTRTAMKATPFGTFCSIIPGRVADDVPSGDEVTSAAGLAVEGDPQAQTSVVRLNKHIFGVLKSHLEQRDAVRLHLDVELNPTLRTDDDKLLFLAEVQGREVFQRMPPNPVLHLMEAMLDERGRMPLRELARTVYEHPDIDATEEEVMPYLDRLIEIGFLRFRWGIAEQEVAWDRPLRTLMEPIDDPHAQQVVELMDVLRDKLDAYDEAGVEAREALIDEMREAVSSTLEALDVGARMRRDLPIYEDATADARATIASAQIDDVRSRLESFVRRTVAASWPRSEQASMRHFFDEYYGSDSAVPLLTFYEDYYREHFKDHLKKQRAQRYGRRAADDEEGAEDYDVNNPFELDAVEAMQGARKAIGDAVKQQWAADPEARVLHVDDGVLDDALADVPDMPQEAWSASMFCQLAPSGDGEAPSLVLPNANYFAGYGKYFSRFLSLFPPEVRERVHRANDDLSTEHVAEICGDAHFNANLHPQLISKEISYPTGESGNAEDQLRASEIAVEPVPNDPHALCLRHVPTGKRVLPVDLGFLNPRMRPPLYQLLSRFTPVANFSCGIPASPDVQDDDEPAENEPDENAQAQNAQAQNAQAKDAKNAEAGDGENEASTPEIFRRPRIVFDERLVIAREQWFVPGPLFPQKDDNESDLDFFLRVQRWRSEHDLPSEVYVRIHPRRARSSQPQEAGEKAEEGTGNEAAEAGDGAAENAAAASPDAEHVEQGEEADDGAEEDADANEKSAQAAKKRTAVSRDYRKPQYIDFENPLLVGLFGRMIGRLEAFTATLIERYPTAEGLPRVDGRAYTNEMILQVNSVPAEDA